MSEDHFYTRWTYALVVFIAVSMTFRHCAQRESESTLQRALDAYGIRDPEGER